MERYVSAVFTCSLLRFDSSVMHSLTSQRTFSQRSVFTCMFWIFVNSADFYN